MTDPEERGLQLPPGAETEADTGIGPEVETKVETKVETHPESERKLNLTVASFLGAGLLVAAGLLIAGAVLALTGHGPYSGKGPSIGAIASAIGTLEPSGFFYLGLIVLLATPVARVVVLALAFAWRRSWTFCALGLFVLVILVLSVLLGLEM